MADQGRWFKLWNTAPGDGKLQALPPEIRWAWAAFGCYTKVHGEHGRVTVLRSNAVLAAEMGVTVDTLFDTILTLPNMAFDTGEVDNGVLIVTWINWKKYQEDSTVYERVKKWRAQQSVTVQEEKRREEKKEPPKSPTGDVRSGFVLFWSHYPRHTHRQNAERAWVKLSPTADLQATMIRAIDHQKATLTAWQDMERIPHAATWINGRRWEDEIPSNGNGKAKADPDLWMPECWTCKTCGEIHETPGGAPHVCPVPQEADRPW